MEPGTHMSFFLITFTDQIYRQGLEGTVASGTVRS